MKEYRSALISSIVIGLGLGILLPTFLLYLMMKTNFSIFTSGFYLELLIICMIPFCVFIVRKFGLSYPIVSGFMLGTSFIIILIYGYIVSQSSAQYVQESNLFQDIFILDILFHLLMVLITTVIYIFYYRHLKSDLEE